MAWWEYLFFQIKYTLQRLDYSRFTSLQSYAACSFFFFFLNFSQTLATVPSCAFVHFLLLFIFSLIFWFQFYFQSGFEHLKACMSGSVWGGVKRKKRKRKKELKLLKFDLTLELIISCWESRKCCVVRLFLSEYIVFTCSSHTQPTQSSYFHQDSLPHLSPSLAANQPSL